MSTIVLPNSGLNWIHAIDGRDRKIWVAIGISILLHGVLVALRFSAHFDKATESSPPLEVVLVNSKTKARPHKAQVLAQANLDGGGNTDAERRAKTPLPALAKDTRTTELSVAARKVEKLESQAKQLIAHVKSKQSIAPQAPPTETLVRPELPSAQELMQRTLEAMRLEAEIAKEWDSYQKRPRRKFVGARAEEYRFARYVEDWRLKIERVGNMNYPEAARARKLYGDLVVCVSIRADGSLEKVEITRGAKHRILNAAAERIAQLGAPYAPFSGDMMRDTDILEICRTWAFTRGDVMGTAALR